MNIKKVIFQIIVFFLVFHLTAHILDIVEISPGLVTWLWIGGSFALLAYFTSDILRFLTVSRNFITIFVATAILGALLGFFLDLTVPGFDVNAGQFGPFDLEFLTINGFPVDTTMAKIMFGATYGFFVAGIQALMPSSSD